MFRFDAKEKRLIKLQPTDSLYLDSDEICAIQECIEKSPIILGENLLVIGKEVMLSSGERLDLLCIDNKGALVIVEMSLLNNTDSRGEWRTIKYAFHCSTLSSEEIFKQYAKHLGITETEAAKAIEEFISNSIEDLNRSQRIILISRSFDPETIPAVIWLRNHGFDIQCTWLNSYLDGEDHLIIKPETLIPTPKEKYYMEKGIE